MEEEYVPEFKIGDKVVMRWCDEAKFYKDKIWTCRTDSFHESKGQKKDVVFLEGFAGQFLTEYLEFANLGFDCQSQIECHNSCEEQCDHCHEYYVTIRNKCN